MMRLFLVSLSDRRRIELGLFKFNNTEPCIKTAQRRLKFLCQLETGGFVYEGVHERGPFRVSSKPTPRQRQLSLQLMTRRKILSNDQVVAIRAAHQPGRRGHGYLALARLYGVGASTVRDICTYRTRKNVRHL